MLEQTQLLPANQKAIVTEVEIVQIHKARQDFWATVTAKNKNNGKKDIMFWGFHGTDDAGIDGIKKVGFKVNHAQTGKNGQTLSLKSIQGLLKSQIHLREQDYKPLKVAQSNSLSLVFLPQNSYKQSKIRTGCKGAFGLWIWDGVWIRDLGWSLDLGLVWS